MIRKIVCFFLVFFSLTACSPYTESDDSKNWEVLTFTVKKNDWQLKGGTNNLDSYYQFIFDDVRELTSFVASQGTVMGYVYQGSGSDEVQTPLPYTIPYGDVVQGNEVLWTETTTFDYQAGSIAFYVNYSDFTTEVRPGTMEFRVVLHW